jgi:hypothetical protein
MLLLPNKNHPFGGKDAQSFWRGLGAPLDAMATGMT